MPAKKRKKNTLDVEIIPKLKNPQDIANCGYQIDVPGSYWNYRGTVGADEKKNLYKCNVVAFRELYRPTPADPFEPHLLLRVFRIGSVEVLQKGKRVLHEEDRPLQTTIFKAPLPRCAHFS